MAPVDDFHHRSLGSISIRRRVPHCDGFARVFDDGANSWRLVDGVLDQEEDTVVVHKTCKKNRDFTLNARFAQHDRPSA
jgi:hypothetical protein